jgi:hypothetical protein
MPPLSNLAPPVRRHSDDPEQGEQMSKVIFDISLSVDGFTTADGITPDEPMRWLTRPPPRTSATGSAGKNPAWMSTRH